MRISYDGGVVRVEELFVAEDYYTFIFVEESNSDNVEVYLFNGNGAIDICAIKRLQNIFSQAVQSSDNIDEDLLKVLNNLFRK